jgi:hypothetical protein
MSMNAFLVRSPLPVCHARADDAVFTAALLSEDEVDDGEEQQRELDLMKADLEALRSAQNFGALEQQGKVYSKKLAQLQAKKATFVGVVKARSVARSALAHADATDDFAGQGTFGSILLRLDMRLKSHDEAEERRGTKRPREEECTSPAAASSSSSAAASSSTSPSSFGTAPNLASAAAAVVVQDGANAPDANIHKNMRPRVAVAPRKTVRHDAWATQKDMTERAWKAKLDSAWTCKYPPGYGVQFSGNNLHGEGYELVTKKPFCNTCKCPVNQKNMSTHRCCPMHVEKKALAAERNAKQLRLDQCIQQFQQQHVGFGTAISELEHQFRCDMVLLFCGSNTSASTADGDHDWFMDKWTKQKGIGSTHFADYVPIVAKFVKDEHIRVQESCYSQFATVDDTTPSFCDAEGVIVRQVTKDWQIVDLLADVALLDKSPTGERHSHEMEKSFEKMQCEWGNWRASMQDGCPVNNKSTNLLQERHSDAKPFRARCSPHTGSNACKKTHTPELDKFMCDWRAVHMHAGNARMHFSETFQKPVKYGQGVRWHLEYEQIDQVNEIGVEQCVEHAEWCVRNKCSEKSAAKLVQKCKDPKFLAATIMQAAAVRDGCRLLVTMTYNLEGSQPLMLVAEDTFKDLDEMAMAPAQQEYPSLPAAATKAIAVHERARKAAIAKIRGDEEAESAELVGKKVLSRISGKWYEGEVMSCKKGSDNINNYCIQMYNVKYSYDNTSADFFRERVVNDAKNLELATAPGGHGQPQDGATGSKPQNKELNYGTAATAEDDEHEKSVQALLKQQLPSADELMSAAKAGVAPAWAYYHERYLAPGADMGHVRKAVKAASVFSFDVLAAATVASATPLIDSLSIFGFPELTDRVLAGIQGELADVLAAARGAYEWADLPGAGKYDKAASGGGGDTNKWRNDPAEKARRFWLRWREMCFPTQQFPHFATAIRLVVLVQPSSAAIERCFSQLKLIVDETGCFILSDLLKLRMFMRCNRRAYEKLNIVI